MVGLGAPQGSGTTLLPIVFDRDVGADAWTPKHLHPLEEDSKYVTVVREALAAGRPQDGETQEDAGFRQSAKIMDLF